MKGILILIALLGLLMFALVVATATPNDREEYEAYMRYKERQKKKEYCAADQLGTVCYHQSSELCQLCKRNEDDRKRLSQEIGIPITKRSRR